jgi:hypothetical protein
MFNTNSPKQSVMLEAKIVEGMAGNTEVSKLEPIDSITFATFTNKFNKKYGDTLLREQKALLSQYISSFSNEEIELKIYLNRELGRLKESLEKAAEIEEVAADKEMINKTKLVKERLDALSNKIILTETTLFTILKTQELVKEIYDDGSNS